jgi:hypothetical protein
MHHELPRQLDLDWYRKQARALLRAVTNADHAALERVRDTVGHRPKFTLSDAQHVIALEHGYAHWADFKRWLVDPTRTEDPPVGRIGRAPVSTHEARAQRLVELARQHDSDAIRRIQHHVARLRTFSGGTLTPADARLVVAREYGFPTWRDLIHYAQKAIDEYEHRPSGTLADAFALIRAGEVDKLRAMLDEQPDLVHATYRGAATTMLEAIAQPDVFGDHLEVALGVDRRIVDLLIERGSAMDTPLNLAACFNRAELVRILLAAGASATATEIWGITPLQTALYHGAREAADLLASNLVPNAPYTAAGTGRLDALASWFFADGHLTPEALRAPRPNLSDVGWPPAPPPIQSAQAVLDECFAIAAYNGRLEPLQYLHARGANIDAELHSGFSALRLARMRRRTDIANWLTAHGARS